MFNKLPLNKQELLTHLRENSRVKLTTVSRKTNIPISTLFDLLKELQDHLIAKSTILLDFSNLGYHVKAQVILKVDRKQKEKLKQHLFFHQNVNSIYKTNSGSDFIVETIHKNIKELDNFVESLHQKFNIEDHKIQYLIDDIKREGFVVG